MPELPIADALRLWAERDPAADAVVVTGSPQRRLSRVALVGLAEAWARRWVADGLAPDAVVAIALPNGVDLVLACTAAWVAGATPMPLPSTLPAAERDRLVEVSGAGLLIDGPLGDPGSAPAYPARGPASAWKVSPSSGSTGTAKLIRAGGAAVVDPDRATTSFLPVAQVQLVAGPLAHAAAFSYAMRGLMTGHALVLMPGFDASAWLRLVTAERVSWAMLSPAAMRAVWDAPERAAADVSSLRTLLHLGAPCPEPLKRRWLDWLGPDRVVEVYAGTESQGLAVIGGRDWLAHPGSVGRGAGGTTFRVVRPDGSDCDAGEAGEVLMRRQQSASSYLADPGTGRTDGWHSLGDLGRLDTEGYLYLDGRLDDVITLEGPQPRRLLPGPVEATLEEHPEVRSALVVERGGRLHAVVEPAALARPTDAELAAWLADRGAVVPQSWELTDRALRDTAGKARRREWR